MSEHDLPSDPNWKPLGHPHSKLPTVLVQVPWQLWVPWTHSFISIEDGSIRINVLCSTIIIGTDEYNKVG